MIFSKNLLVVYLFAILLFSGCSEKDEFKPYLKGDIVGYAFYFDEFGNEPEDFSGINVITLPGRQYSAVTDEKGRYELKNVINGTYDLSFEKEGFGTMILSGVKHLGGTPTVMGYYYGNKAPYLYQNISTRITHLEIDSDTVIASVSLSGAYQPFLLRFRFFFSTQENFDTGSAQAIKNITVFDVAPFYKSSPLESIYSDLPFESGDKVYYRAGIFSYAYTVTFYDEYHFEGIDTYFDYEKNKTIYPNLSDESEEFSFIMP